MAYEQFLETVREKLQTLLGPPHRLSLRPVPKNNGVELKGICDVAEGSPIAPMVYLNAYYERYLEGAMSLDEICSEVLEIFRDHPAPDCISTEDFSDIEKMRPIIMMRLIHRESNRKLLEDIPYFPFLDLAIVFYLSIYTDENGQMTILIHLEHMKRWGLTPADLLRIARQNTPNAYPAQIHSMMQVLKGFSAEDPENGFSDAELSEIFDIEGNDLPLFVLTNSSGIYGAACILYHNTLKSFADIIDHDLIIIPSSVHEVLLAPYDEDMDLAAIDQMVKEINRSDVLPEERLSDHVYRYSRQTDDISIPVSQSPAACL